MGIYVDVATVQLDTGTYDAVVEYFENTSVVTMIFT